MNGPEKSDSPIVAVKPANEAARAAEEQLEPRGGTKENADQQILSLRMADFELGLHPEKTRLIEFGRKAIARCGAQRSCVAAGGASGSKRLPYPNGCSGAWRKPYCRWSASERDIRPQSSGERERPNRRAESLRFVLPYGSAVSERPHEEAGQTKAPDQRLSLKKPLASQLGVRTRVTAGAHLRLDPAAPGT